tara:strand:- start:1270 stop:1539 length:270 start_codon:yes stop_codon:yes gene_type:complete
MKPIEFIFELLKNFVPIQPSRIEGLKKEGQDWYAKNVDEADNPKGLMKPLKQHADEWYSQLGLGVLYIFAFRWLSNFMNGSSEDDYERR